MHLKSKIETLGYFMKTKVFLLSLTFTLAAQARFSLRHTNEWDTIAKQIRCVQEMRKFVLTNHFYSSEPAAVPELLSLSGVPRKKIKCAARVVDDVGEGLAICSTDPSRNPYRFSGSGFDCPHRYIEQVKISDEMTLRIQYDDKCDINLQSADFWEQKIIKTPHNASDDAVKTQASRVLKEAVIDIYNKFDPKNAYSGKTTEDLDEIDEIENKLRIFFVGSCGSDNLRDPEIGPVAQRAVDRTCAAKAAIPGTGRRMRCAVTDPTLHGWRSERSQLFEPAPSSPASAPGSPSPSLPSGADVDQDD